jgi:hypothetical protein
VPTGNTGFEFDASGFSFDSETNEWLVVNEGGTDAQFKGRATVNGGLDRNGNPYKFMIWAADGSPDTLHIRIWWEEDGVETAVYDNGTDQAIGASDLVPLGRYFASYIPARVHQPGDITASSNFGPSLAGCIVKQVSGAPLTAL